MLTLAIPRPAVAEVGAPGGCVSTVTRGVEVTTSDGVRFIRSAHGLAQGFLAPDTLISAVTVWMPGDVGLQGISLQLAIIRADDEGRPLPDEMIVDGGSLDQGESDDPGSSRYTFTFDPPAVLPAAGRYALVIATEHGEVIPLRTDSRNDYADGEMWELARREGDGRYTSVSSRMRSSDLNFRVGFCEGGTATTGRTWGEVKTLYR